jgi:hypothetical protein
MAVLYAGYIVVTARTGIYDNMGTGSAMTAQPAFANNPQAALTLGIAMLAIGLLMMPAFVYGLLMTLRYSLAIPACVVENLPAGQALRRSIALAKNSWGRIFLLMLLVGVIKIGIGGLTQIFVVVFSFKHPGQLPGPGLSSVSAIIGFFTNSFLGPIWAAGITLFYYDQRIRKEGFDIEWMMQAAGLNAPPAAEAAPTLVEAPPELSAPQESESGAAHE